MKTQIIRARNGDVTDVMKKVACQENLPILEIQERLSDGSLVISSNPLSSEHRSPLGIGRGVRTKVNANIGTSKSNIDLNVELEKLKVAQKAGADAVMDLSTGGNLTKIRRAISAECKVSMGTVPIYQAIAENSLSQKPPHKIKPDRFFEIIREHAQDGIDFITVHCGITQGVMERYRNQGRIMGIVSRGGAFLANWMSLNEQENPLYEQYDRLLDIALEFDLTLSLGDALRPGSILDSTDRAQIEELITLGELARRANDVGVGIIIEGPGHVPLNEIKANIEMEKKLCNNAPFYILGPLVTDIAPGYDHITSAIGGALAGAAGGDFLCYVTPSEHLCLPSVKDVHEGVIACRIAAHAADIAKGLQGAIEKDRQISVARKNLDWDAQSQLAIDPQKVLDIKKTFSLHKGDACTMCGDLCSIKVDYECKSRS